MMGINEIRAMSTKAAQRAAEEGQTPFVYWDIDEVRRAQGFPFPFLGDYVPDGWTQDEGLYFVDASGLGADDEPALSVRQFKDKIVEVLSDKDPRTRVGWAIVEVGQFQVYVASYRQEQS